MQPRGRIERVPLRPGLAVDVFRRLLRLPVGVFGGLLEVAGALLQLALDLPVICPAFRCTLPAKSLTAPFI